MRKINKITANLLRKSEKAKPKKIEEHREEVLARGRKFKYPIQYSKHRLVINTIIIGVFVATALIVGGAMALYKFNSTSDLIYRITKVVPVPVAEIEGRSVRYSDYLLVYRSSIAPIEQQTNKIDEKKDIEAMRKHYKKTALAQAIEFTYALKRGEELGVKVTHKMVDDAIDKQRAAGGVKQSKASFQKILKDNFGISEKEYRRMVYLSLVRKEVSVREDKEAARLIGQVEKEVKASEGDFKAVAEKMGKNVLYFVTDGKVNQMNIDGGRSDAARELEKGKVSKSFVSANGDSYFVVKLLDKNQTEVSYESLQVMIARFDKKIQKLKKNGAVKEFIRQE